MGELLTGLANISWVPAMAAFIFGIASGWLIWSRPNSDDVAQDGTALSGLNSNPRNSAKIEAVEKALQEARDHLDALGEENQAATEELATLDEAIKRANGRLKLLLKAVKKADPGA